MTKSRYTIQFFLLCISSLLFFASFNMLIPELPAFLTALDGGQYKGYIISLFTLTALISRPFSGKLADNIGRKPVIISGAVVCMFCSLLYPLLTTVFAFFMLRIIHGFSTGFTPTGQSTYVSDIIPAERRGEAMGLIGMVSSVGMAMGPAIGGMVAREYGLNVMFYLSSAFGFIAAVIVIGMKETLPTKKSFNISMLKIDRHDLFEPRVLLPCIIMGLSYYAYGVMLTLIPDFGEHVGIHRKELLFTVFTIASIVIRVVGGKASDKYGRVPVLVISTAVVMIAMLMISVAETQPLLIAGMILYGLGQGSVSPALLAWATDLSEERHKGRALASLYIFMEFGIGVGAFASGWFYRHEWSGFFIPFAISSALAGVAFITLLLKPVIAHRSHRSH
ncbi:MAG: MFS transporter [Bacteroidota bacterium]